jgi:hypothetical protein
MRNQLYGFNMKNNIRDLSMKNKTFLTAAASVLALSLSTSAFAIPSFSLDLNQAGLAAGGTNYVDGVTAEIGTFVGASSIFPLEENSTITTTSLLDENGLVLSQGFGDTDDIEGFDDNQWKLNWNIGSGAGGALSIGDVITVNFIDATPASQLVASLSITSLTLNAITDANANGSLDYASISAEFISVMDNFWIFNGVAQTNPLLSPLRELKIDASGISIDVAAVPEPSLIALFGLGLVGMGIASRRRKQA